MCERPSKVHRKSPVATPKANRCPKDNIFFSVHRLLAFAAAGSPGFCTVLYCFLSHVSRMALFILFLVLLLLCLAIPNHLMMHRSLSPNRAGRVNSSSCRLWFLVCWLWPQEDIAQDLTMQWSTLSGFMQDLSLLVIHEGQQYGTDREIAVISLLKQQPLVLWTGDSQQTPGGVAQAAPNAKRSRQLLLAKKHGLRSDRNYYMPSNLAETMIRLLDNSSNEGLAILSQVLRKGDHALGNLWTSQLSQPAAQDLQEVNTVLPGLNAQYRAAQPNERAQLPTMVDPQLLEGTTINFPRSLVRHPSQTSPCTISCFARTSPNTRAYSASP